MRKSKRKFCQTKRKTLKKTAHELKRKLFDRCGCRSRCHQAEKSEHFSK